MIKPNFKAIRYLVQFLCLPHDIREGEAFHFFLCCIWMLWTFQMCHNRCVDFFAGWTNHFTHLLQIFMHCEILSNHCEITSLIIASISLRRGGIWILAETPHNFFRGVGKQFRGVWQAVTEVSSNKILIYIKFKNSLGFASCLAEKRRSSV